MDLNSDLKHLQRLVKQAIKNQDWSETLASELRGESVLETLDRIEVYRFAYWQRLSESLEEDFTSVQASLGSQDFEATVKAFVTQTGSRYTSLATVSQDFADWIQTSLWAFDRPYLGDLAKLDWHKNLAFLLRESEYFDFCQLSTLQKNKTSPDETDFSQLRLTVNPTTQFLFSKWNFSELGLDPENRESSFQVPALQNFSSLYLSWKARGELHELKLDGFLISIFSWIKEGCTLGKISESFDTKLKEASDLESITLISLQEIFSDWTSRGLICGFRMQS